MTVKNDGGGNKENNGMKPIVFTPPKNNSVKPNHSVVKHGDTTHQDDTSATGATGATGAGAVSNADNVGAVDTVNNEESTGKNNSNETADMLSVVDADYSELFDGENNHGVNNVDTHDDNIPPNDIVLDEQDNRGLVQQEDNVVAWSIDGLYKPNGRKHSKWHLKQNPPILNITDENGSEVSFTLTENLSKHLYYATNNVHKAYYGVDVGGINGVNTFTKTKRWVALGLIVTAIIIVLLVNL